MSHPVKLSDSLVLDARLTGKNLERSIAGQIEFWASLGRSVEFMLQTPQLLALRKAGAVRDLSTCIDEVDTPAGKQRVADFLNSQPFPHYEADPASPGVLIRTDEDGTRTRGRFVNRRFEILPAKKV